MFLPETFQNPIMKNMKYSYNLSKFIFLSSIALFIVIAGASDCDLNEILGFPYQNFNELYLILEYKLILVLTDVYLRLKY